MSRDIVEKSFRSAEEKVQKAYDQTVDDLKAKVAKAKSDTLEKLSQ
jgi:hypothetical protein